MQVNGLRRKVRCYETVQPVSFIEKGLEGIADGEIENKIFFSPVAAPKINFIKHPS